jgi:hypothetical protein
VKKWWCLKIGVSMGAPSISFLAQKTRLGAPEFWDNPKWKNIKKKTKNEKWNKQNKAWGASKLAPLRCKFDDFLWNLSWIFHDFLWIFQRIFMKFHGSFMDFSSKFWSTGASLVQVCCKLAPLVCNFDASLMPVWC